MKRRLFMLLTIMTLFVFGPVNSVENVYAEDTIFNGIHIESIDVSGMTKEEAIQAVNNYIEEIKNQTVTLDVAQGQKVDVQIATFSPTWKNQEIIDDVLDVAKEGNVVQRYKAIKDIQNKGMNYNIELDFDTEAVKTFLNDNCAKYDLEMQNPKLKRENGGFNVIDGTNGEKLDIEASLSLIENELMADYRDGKNEIQLPIKVVEPESKADDLMAITDILGTYTTSYSTSSSNRCVNVENGCRLVNGTTLYPGEEFSFYNKIKPFTAENGYKEAPSYLNGGVIESFGGGICQVSSTLYNAVLRAELEVTERSNHSMIVTYVPKSADAAISENNKDFKFINTTNSPIYIEGITAGKKITFNVYGVDTRPANRTVEFESEQISETIPDHDILTPNPGAFIGSFSVVASQHVGYKAKLWKVVYEDGVEVSREQVNSSTYKPTPRTVSVGVATDNPDAYNRMAAAISTGSLDMCKATAALILSGN